MSLSSPELDGSHLETEDSLLQAVNAFYTAFNGRNLNAMQRVWASDGILYNPVGGIVRGWPEIQRVYERLFTGAVHVHVVFYDYAVRTAGDLAFVAGRERGTARRGNQSLTLAIRTSRIFAGSEGEWRQVHHHGSIDDPAALVEYQRLVRS